jgi:glycosyltransferase involved in cell wall biosynthesis
MNILFIHNNFPAQFRSLAEELAKNPAHRVTAVGAEGSQNLPGVDLRRYRMPSFNVAQTHPFARRFDAECHRATQVLYVLSELRASGFEPDLIVGHCGWGETLPLRSVFPKARIAIYCEFYYRPEGQDVHFDPEGPQLGVDGLVTLHCKNASTLLSIADADIGLSPTEWQKATYPPEYKDKIQVVHEGVDAERLRGDDMAQFLLADGTMLHRGDEIVTYIARNLEPVRGFHIFMRALPRILAERPRAQVVIVGGEGVSYGASPPEGSTWKSIYLDEVAADVDLARVHFLPPLPYEEYVRLLQVSRVHIYLTFPFVLSWSLVEAMAIGCVIVASDTAPVREAIAHEVNGLLTPFLEPDALAEKVVAVLADPARFEPLREAARATALARYNRRECLAQALELLGLDETATMQGARAVDAPLASEATIERNESGPAPLTLRRGSRRPARTGL